MIDEFKSMTWELKQGEFDKICALYKQTLEKKGLTPDKYNIDDFLSDVFSVYLQKLEDGELEVIVNNEL